MHYIQHGIEKLSKNQVSKLLRGHPTRIKAGKHHNIHLSQEHSKKIMRAHQKGMGITVQLDPYAIMNNQHLRKDVGMRGKGTGTDLGATLGHVVGKVAEAGGTRAVDAIAGTDKDSNEGAYDNSMVAAGLKKRRGRGVKVNIKGHIGIPSSFQDPISGLTFGNGIKKRGRPRKMHGRGTPPTMMFNNAPIPPEEALRIQQEMNRAVKQDKKRDEKHGGSVNRINKFNRWTNVLGDAYQGIAHAVKPMAVPIIQAGTDRAVEMINPESTEDYLNNYVGYGVKKHRGRPRKMKGSALYPAGY